MLLNFKQRVALLLGWLACGVVWVAADFYDIHDWRRSVATGAAGFLVTFAAIRWPFVEER